jgi:heme exporter protein D
VKILLTDIYKMPVWLSLGIIVAILAVSVGASLWANRRAERRAALDRDPEAHGTSAADGDDGSAAKGVA